MKTAFQHDVSDLLRQAAARQSEGRLEEAERLYAAAAGLAPEQWQPIYRLAAFELERGAPERALPRLGALAHSGAPAAEFHYLAGRVHRALGDAPRAAAHFGQALACDPGHAQARVSLGILLKGEGRLEEARECFERAAAARPGLAEAHLNLGALLKERGELEPAARALARGLELWPEFAQGRVWLAEVLNDLGVLRLASGEAIEGLACLRRAAALDPGSAETLGNLGLALLERGEAAAGLEVLERAARADPGAAVSHANLARARLATRDASGALEAARAGLRLDPAHPEARMAAAGALRHLERWEEAERELAALLAAAPDRGDAHMSLGELLLERGRFAESERAFERAAALQPRSAEALSNLGVARYQAGRPREALELFERAVALRPEHYPTRLWRAMAHLMLGELEAGWREFEWRWRGFEQLGRAEFRFPAPRWNGEALRGRTILLHGEQGMGDVLQFARFAAQVAQRGARVWLYVHPPLVRLLRSAPGVQRVYAFDEVLPAFDYHCPLMSLPGVLGVGLDGLPAGTSYLAAHPAERARWQRRLEPAGGLRVGLAWSGDPRRHDRLANLTDARRSVRLAELAPLARVPGVRWVSLQKGEAAAQASSPPEGMVLEDYTAGLTDFADTAALVANLDLVIAVDTSIVHLAGALGRPVWMLSRFDGCWRWMLGRSDSPWYPTLRIFRQSAPLDWSAPLREMADALARLA